MTKANASTPFPLGAYLGNPNNANAADQAQFDANYTSMTAVEGVAPKYFDIFIDQSQPVSGWVGNTQWNASSSAASADASTMTPVIALPLNSTASGAPGAQQSFEAFASGQYDSVLRSIVATWVGAGFTNLVFRPGWEMNLSGNNYAGDSAQSQADWVSAFQHVSTVLHQAAAADGAKVQVVWNPSTTNYSNAEATTNLYPGNAYVDAIGADTYANIYPYSDGGPTAAYHDWDTGGTDTTVAQFIADPVNRDHFWSYPAATRWSLDGSGGHSQSLTSLIQFAEAQGKPFALPETGAGNSNDGRDVNDDAAFPQWLAQQLTAAQAAGETISFVNLWNNNGGGNYEFSYAADNKPAEAAAWAKYFGATQQASAAVSAAPAAAVTLGSGADTLALAVAEDAWRGDAQFTVSVDGTQIGGTQTATASHAAGQTQVFNVKGNFAAGNHAVSVNFLNDAYGGTADTDRNLFVQSAQLDGVAVAGSTLNLYSAGTQSFTATNAAPTQPDTLDLHVSEDAWLGDAQFTVSINGTTVGGVHTATASHAAGATQDVTVAGNWGPGQPTIGITFINDAWGGTASTDRNLFVDGVSYDGQASPGAPATLLSNGTVAFTLPGGAVPIALHLSEDAWQGDAQYAVSIDGKVLVGNATATALHAQGASQTVNLQALLSPGTHDLALSFLNDAYGGTAATDRNLFLTGIDVNGKAASGATAALLSAGTQHFQIVVPAHL